jgi:coenzyme F420-reducing hydrogenase gamma subunit
MARLFTVAISEANYNKTEEQIWLLNNVCSRIKSLATVSHSVSNDSYAGYTDLIELLVQVIEASTGLNGYPPQYQEIEKALKSLLVGYESQYSESQIKEARQEYANKQSDFQEELDQIEEKLDCDGGLECNEAWQFFHRDARRRRPIRKFR